MLGCAFLGLAVSLVALAHADPANADTFVINSAGDASDNATGDGLCDTGGSVVIGGGPVDECTLRAAIEEANAWPEADVAEFEPSMPTNSGSSVLIQPATAYPAITETLVIDGRTAPGFVAGGTPRVSISGAGILAGSADGLAFVGTVAADSAVYALAIHGFGANGIRVDNASRFAVHSSHLGVAAGFLPVGNGANGILLQDGLDSRVGPDYDPCCGLDGSRNVISGNLQNGVEIRGSRHLVVDNYIGTDPAGQSVGTGTSAFSNDGHGVYVASGTNNTIGMVGSPFGGDEVARGNLISGNGGAGIYVEDAALETSIQANRIGTDIDGDTARPNAVTGLWVVGSDTRVGSVGPGRNLIGPNNNSGLIVGRPGFPDTLGTRIVGNVIGVDETQTALLGSSLGIQLSAQAVGTLVSDNVVGGSTSSGIEISGPGTVVRNNEIGTNAAGANLGNGGNGIFCGASGVVIGGPDATDGNLIGFNGTRAITANGCDDVRIENNRVGTDGAGADLGNTEGIWINASDRAIVRHNVIGNGSYGMTLRFSDDARVQHNRIGIDASGNAIANGGHGVLVEESAGAKIGVSFESPLPAVAGNVIANNAAVGVQVLDAGADDLEASIRGNSIYGQPAVIELGAGPADPNDPDDADTGPNLEQNSPELDAVATQYDEVANEITVRYRVDSLFPNARYPIVVDFYTGDGRYWVGSDVYPIGAQTQEREITFTPDASAPAPTGTLRATATDANGEGNTSVLGDPVALPEPGRLLSILAGGALLRGLASRRRRGAPTSPSRAVDGGVGG